VNRNLLGKKKYEGLKVSLNDPLRTVMSNRQKGLEFNKTNAQSTMRSDNESDLEVELRKLASKKAKNEPKFKFAFRPDFDDESQFNERVHLTNV
jgi:hypothetical protein